MTTAEYISGALLAWAEIRGIRIERIQPGQPQQNAYVERYNRTVRYDWFGQTLFESVEAVQESATRWLWTYNHERPNMGLDGITPIRKLALAAQLHFWRQPRMGDYPRRYGMSETTPGFDRKNVGLYMNTTALLCLGSLTMVVRIVMGNPPAFVTDPVLSGWVYLASALVAAAAMVALKKSDLRGFYVFCAPVAAFVVAGFVSGFPAKPLWLMSIVNLTVLAFCIAMGDKADQNTKEKTIRFKLPW